VPACFVSVFLSLNFLYYVSNLNQCLVSLVDNCKRLIFLGGVSNSSLRVTPKSLASRSGSRRTYVCRVDCEGLGRQASVIPFWRCLPTAASCRSASCCVSWRGFKFPPLQDITFSRILNRFRRLMSNLLHPFPSTDTVQVLSHSMFRTHAVGAKVLSMASCPSISLTRRSR
jgi:hypothetical protein